jgi:hypothetical protein
MTKNGEQSASANSQAAKPNKAFSLSRAAHANLAKYAKPKQHSAFVEEAIAEKVALIEGRAQGIEQLTTAATFLAETHPIYLTNAGVAKSFAEDTMLNIAYIAHALEQLFHVRPPSKAKLEIPTGQGFDQLKNDAVAVYAQDPTLTDLDAIHAKGKALRDAATAFGEANQLEQVTTLLNDMPFMAEQRFYVEHNFSGLALFDREHPNTTVLLGARAQGDFPVVQVDLGSGEMFVTYSTERPHFALVAGDRRLDAMAKGLDEMAQIIPVIVADYIAFRKFESAKK